MKFENINKKTPREERILELKGIISEKEKKKNDATMEKVELIKLLNHIEYTQEDKDKFDEWMEQIPINSLENPIVVKDISDIYSYIPDAPNYTRKEVNLNFKIESGIDNDEIDLLFEEFCDNNPSFEICAIIFPENKIVITIGDKTRTHCNIKEGCYYAHSHPTRDFDAIDNKKSAKSFVSKIVPSPGDISGSLMNFEMVKNGTKIFSKLGNSEIKFKKNDLDENFKKKLLDYRNIYFDSYLGESKFSNDEEIIKYLKDKFSIEIKFNYE